MRLAACYPSDAYIFGTFVNTCFFKFLDFLGFPCSIISVYDVYIYCGVLLFLETDQFSINSELVFCSIYCMRHISHSKVDALHTSFSVVKHPALSLFIPVGNAVCAADVMNVVCFRSCVKTWKLLITFASLIFPQSSVKLEANNVTINRSQTASCALVLQKVGVRRFLFWNMHVKIECTCTVIKLVHWEEVLRIWLSLSRSKEYPPRKPEHPGFALSPEIVPLLPRFKFPCGHFPFKMILSLKNSFRMSSVVLVVWCTALSYWNKQPPSWSPSKAQTAYCGSMCVFRKPCGEVRTVIFVVRVRFDMHCPVVCFVLKCVTFEHPVCILFCGIVPNVWQPFTESLSR
jgi:hypothetical protein